MNIKSYFIRFPNGCKNAVTFSYDDGSVHDIRLARIFKKYNIKATFNLNSGLMARNETEGNINGRLTLRQAKELFNDQLFEVACHGYNHIRLDSFPPSYAVNEIVKDKEMLEDLFERPIRGLAYPYGSNNTKGLDEALSAAGIAYGRTVNSTEKFNIPLSDENWLHLDPTCHHNDKNLLTFADALIENNDERYPLLFYVWGHSNDFESGDNWEIIENLCKKIGNRNNIWYATNIEIYDYFDAFNNLITSAALTRIYNPSAIPVWVQIDGKTIKINPGEIVETI